MNTKFLHAFFAVIFLLGANIAANAQAREVIPKPTAYTTTPKTFIAKLKNGEQDVYDIVGNISFTVTAANSDDTVAGTVDYTIPDEARRKIAAQSGKPLNSVPNSITRKEVTASFEQATALPVIHLLINPMEVDVAGAKVYFNSVTLDINARPSGSRTKYTNEEIESLFTIWVRQILDGRARHGIIARMNKVINGKL